jgi:hypothetical protein
MMRDFEYLYPCGPTTDISHEFDEWLTLSSSVLGITYDILTSRENVLKLWPIFF